MVNRLILSNFKRYDTLDVELGRINEIDGANGTGKTSILEAIYVVYYGKLPDGSQAIEKLIKNGADECAVSIIDDSGQTITRTISRKSSSKLSVNGKVISQSNFEQLNKLVPVEYFLCAVNPNYWMALDYKLRREVMVDLMPTINRVAVFEEMYDKKLSQQFAISTYQEVNKQIRELEMDIENRKGQIMQVQAIQPEQVGSSKVVEFDEKAYGDLLAKEKKHSLLSEEHQKYSVELQNAENNAVKVTETEERIEAIKKNANIVMDKYPELKEFESLQAVQDVIAKYNGISNGKYKIGQSISVCEDKIKSLKELIDSSICPLCKQQITGEHLKTEVVMLEQELSELQKQEKKYDDNLNKVVHIRDRFGAYSDELKVLKAELQILTQQLSSLKTGPKVKDIQKKLDRILAEDVWNKEKDPITLEALKEQKISRDLLNNIELKAKEEKKGTLQSLNKGIEESESRLSDLRVLQIALSPKGVDAEIVKRQTTSFVEIVNKYASGVEIETIQPLKTDPDRYQEVFNVFKNTIQESKLSTGQRMILAVAFSLAIQDLLQEKFGTTVKMLFIDDASLITSLDKIKNVAIGSQQFYALNTTDTKVKLSIEK
jgi:DNA repair exonuclease SbcCD ATPase subunit